MTTACLLTFILLVLVKTSAFSYNFDGEELDHQTMPPDKIVTPDIIREPKGTTITLKCSVSHCNHHRKHFKWEVKYCRSGAKNSPCNHHSSFTSELAFKNQWKRISAKQTQTISCFDNEKISNLKVQIENDVLYRCSVNNYTVKIYQLEIAEPERVKDGSPRILEMYPGNITVPIGSQLILQCKVYSTMHPLQIFWFKQCHSCKDHVVYNNTHYTKINTTVDTSAVQKDTNVYVSKLNIYKVGLMDNGVYACVGVNGNSFSVKTTTVKIQRFDNWEPHASFCLLFLIPLAFALVPITVWLCYYRNRQKHIDRAIFQQRKKLIKVHNSQGSVV